jgi:tetratricopeptide (TPR) repeat protein
MGDKKLISALMIIAGGIAWGQSSGSTAPFVPGVTFQSTNPNYPLPNPFYFEGKIDWNLLQITTPANAWEYEQRALYEQDDLNDPADALADYQKALSLNSLQNGSCQILTVAPAASGPTNPAPCMFTVRLRLATMMQQSNPQQAIELYQEVLKIDPLMLGVNEAIGKTYAMLAPAEATAAATTADYNSAIAAYQAELALSPVTAFTTALTADTANNAHVHWALAEIYRTTGNSTQESSELMLYLQATQWHSDTYPWRIALAKARLTAAGVDFSLPTPQVARPKADPAQLNGTGKKRPVKNQ